MTTHASGFRTFVIVWCGLFVSTVGSNLTGFALGIYVYQSTGLVSTLGIVFALAIVPSIVVSPVAGSLVDRWGAGRALLVSNVGAMVVTSVLAVLLVTDTLALPYVYVIVSAMSVLSALDVPAFGALVPQLVPRHHLGRANGLRIFAIAASELLAPMAAGFLLLAIELQGIVVMDLVSFAVAIVTLLVVRLPGAPRRAEATSAGASSLLAEFRDGWRYVAARRGMLVLLVFFGAMNFSAGFVDVLVTPLVLAFASPSALGTTLTIGGLGMLVTSLAMTAWGGPRRRVRGILVCSLVLAVATVIGASRPNVALVAVAAFVFLGALGIVNATSHGIWQSKVEPQLLGRVIALVNMVASIPMVVAYTLAGLLADRIFEPLVVRDGPGSATLAMLVGRGPGRGIALLMMAMGALIAVWVVVAALHPRLRRLEEEVPDVAAEEDDASTEPVAANV